MVDWYWIIGGAALLVVLVLVWSVWHGKRTHKRHKRRAKIHSRITGKFDDRYHDH